MAVAQRPRIERVERLGQESLKVQTQSGEIYLADVLEDALEGKVAQCDVCGMSSDRLVQLHWVKPASDEVTYLCDFCFKKLLARDEDVFYATKPPSAGSEEEGPRTGLED